MPKTTTPFTRRNFLKTSIAATAGAAALPLTGRAFIRPMQTAKYTRYNVMSPGGQKALQSYAVAVDRMLRLPATQPKNWFRNAFIHIMDCPHGNWWFYVWHRGYLGFFEETVRNISGDSSFAFPYWDWTKLPEIPMAMFDGPLTPTDLRFEPYTKNFAVFTSFIQPALTAYWNSLNSAQRSQLNTRGYTSFDLLWNDVTGYSPSASQGISGNMAYAITCGSRYLSRDNRGFDAKTSYAVSPFVIDSGLAPTQFYNQDISLSFNSSKTPSHNTAPNSSTAFSILEGFPHNKVHNYIGGVGPIDPGPYGNMTNFLSPVDPIFFLHHSNMDRLWDVWTRKQQSRGLPWGPSPADKPAYDNELFLFYVNGRGEYVGTTRAIDVFTMQRFDYQYEPGYGDDLIDTTTSEVDEKGNKPRIRGMVRANTATLAVPSDAIREHLAEPRGASLIAEISVPHPTPSSPTREFDVLVNAPAGVTSVDVDSPYYAGTIAFFGNMSHAHPGAEARFAVPLPKKPQAFQNLGAVNSTVNIRIVPAHGRGKTPIVKSAIIRAV